jgi:PBP1b-binding outer membrane lipoprotein LpoB
MKTLLLIAIAAAVLAGCVVVPARPAYYRPAVVVY